MARLRLHALLASHDRGRRALGQAFRARSHRPAAALSAILDHDDGIILQGMERHGELQGADHDHRVLSHRTGFHRGVGRAGEAGIGRGGRRTWARVVLRPRPARAGHQGGRSLSGAGRTDGESDCRWLGEIEWSICYQSRVGPLKWIGPSTDAEIRRAGADKVGVVIYPLAFVSEHSETLVELDIDYRHLAKRVGLTTYIRVPTVGTHPLFVAGLARLVRDAL